jgi:molecular chaperone GrpE
MNKNEGLETEIEKKSEEKSQNESHDEVGLNFLIELKNKNEELIEELKKAEEDILRVKAEGENLRKRYEKQIIDTKDYSVANFAKDLLSVLDNINRALSHLPESIGADIKNIIIGVDMTKKELEGVLSRHGVSEIVPELGTSFDHNLHHVISQVESDEHKAGSIIAVPQLGYTLKGRLLRPASVILAKESKKD